MRLTRLYFCYGSVLTSVLWLTVVIVYSVIYERSVPSPYDGHVMVNSADDAPLPKQPGMSRQDEPVAEKRASSSSSSSSSSLPDLDQLAIVRSQQDKLIRADGNIC